MAELNKTMENEAESLFRKGDVEYKTKDYEKAVEYYRKAVDLGHIEAQYRLGWAYNHGEGVPQDYMKAAELYEKAVEQGYANAQLNLCLLYAYGQGVPQDFHKAVVLFHKARKQGYRVWNYVMSPHCKTAKEDIDKLHEIEEIVEQYVREEMEQTTGPCPKLRRAAEQGDAHAQFKYGIACCREAPAYAKRAEWWTKAAEQGHVEAQYELGCLFYTGERGVLQDYEKAVYWLGKAKEKGHEGAKNHLRLNKKPIKSIKQLIKSLIMIFNKR